MSEIVAIVIRCEKCNYVSVPKLLSFEVEKTNTCPGCDGSYEQATCLCGGYMRKTLEFQCVHCEYYGTIEVE